MSGPAADVSGRQGGGGRDARTSLSQVLHIRDMSRLALRHIDGLTAARAVADILQGKSRACSVRRRTVVRANWLLGAGETIGETNPSFHVS